MSELGELEREVGKARQRVANDVARLFDADTWKQSAENVKAQALEYKDKAIESLNAEVEARGSALYETMRDKVVANPIAAGAIVAGLAWRLFRHPPIATALVAGGLYALGKTDRYDDRWSAPKLLETVQDKVSGAAQSVSETAHDLADQAYQKMTDAKDAVAETISPGGQMPQTHRGAAAPQPLDTYLLATAALALGAAVAMAQNNR